MNKNNLFYLCSLLEAVARATDKNKKDVVNKIGKAELKHLYAAADVNHCLPIEQVTEEVAKRNGFEIQERHCKKQKTTIWEIGKVYQRLIVDISNDNDWLENLIEVYNSWICGYLDNQNLPIYWQPRGYIKECYLQKKIID